MSLPGLHTYDENNKHDENNKDDKDAARCGSAGPAMGAVIRAAPPAWCAPVRWSGRAPRRKPIAVHIAAPADSVPAIAGLPGSGGPHRRNATDSAPET